MNDLTLLKTTKALFSLKDEFTNFTVETEIDGIHLGNIELMKTDLEIYLTNEENQSNGI